MLKTVSSVANAIGALNYKGTWNATTNTPALASGVGTQGDYYVVSVAGATDLNGITNWGVGDWAAFNGSVWQRVEGGADGNFVNLDVTGATTLDGNLDISGDIDFGTTGAKIHTVSDDLVAGTGDTALRFHDGDNAIYPVNASSGVKVNGAVTLGDNTARLNNIYMAGDLIVSSGSGIDFSATAGTGTSELLSDYEEGTWTPTLVGSSGGSATMTLSRRTYTKIGNVVHLFMYLSAIDTTAGGFSGAIQIEGLPFSPANGSEQGVVSTVCDIFTTDEQQIGISGQILSNKIILKKGASTTNYTNSDLASTSSGTFMLHATYRA